MILIQTDPVCWWSLDWLKIEWYIVGRKQFLGDVSMRARKWRVETGLLHKALVGNDFVLRNLVMVHLYVKCWAGQFMTLMYVKKRLFCHQLQTANLTIILWDFWEPIAPAYVAWKADQDVLARRSLSTAEYKHTSHLHHHTLCEYILQLTKTSSGTVLNRFCNLNSVICSEILLCCSLT